VLPLSRSDPVLPPRSDPPPRFAPGPVGLPPRPAGVAPPCNFVVVLFAAKVIGNAFGTLGLADAVAIPPQVLAFHTSAHLGTPAPAGAQDQRMAR
jgi:hypothetical protein